VLSAVELVGLLAEERRRRVVAALCLGAENLDEVRAATGLSTREAVTAVERLVGAGLVERHADGGLVVLVAAFGRAAREAASAEEEEPASTERGSAEAAKVRRAFVRDRRLLAIPASHAKRLVVLDLVVQDFEPGRRYTERQVNAILVSWHPDTASLRRWLVDVGFLDRSGGEYWRSGGTVPTDA
jgi:hypothetical protein